MKRLPMVPELRLPELVGAYLTASLAAGTSRGTTTYRRTYLQQLLKWLRRRSVAEARQVTAQMLQQYLVHVSTRRTWYGRLKPSRLSWRTIAAEASVLRSFFRWLKARRVVLFNPAEGLRIGNRSSALPRIILTEAEMETLLAAPGTDTLGLRDRAILETLYSTGLRRAELCGLDRYDLDTPGEVILVREGKGGRDRVVPVGSHALAALKRYLDGPRCRLLGKAKEQALFIAAITGRRLSVKTLNYIVRKHAAAAGIAKRVTPHILRHTFATHLHQGGADIRHVQEILGHASISNTQIYTRVAVEDLVAAHSRHHPRVRLGGV
jgi:integrase/recombinase XerD